MTRFLEERGIRSQFINGLRVTTAEVLDAVVKVVAGTVNQELVAAFTAAGIPAVGLTGLDAGLTEAEPLSADLGFVGKPVRSNPHVLEILTAKRLLPVVACVAGDRAGNIYNVNADQMAVSCAGAFQVDRLLFLTDVEGVRSASGEVLPALSPAQGWELIHSGVATGGMQAKLEAAIGGLAAGIHEVVIAPGARPGVVGDLLSNRSLGTRIS